MGEALQNQTKKQPDVQELYQRLIALDFENAKKEDIDESEKKSFGGIEDSIKDYKEYYLEKKNESKLKILEKISADLKDLKDDANINNISVEFNQNFEAFTPKEGSFGIALSYERIKEPIKYDKYNISSYIHYVSVIEGEWTDKNLVILEGEVYQISDDKKLVKLLENFEVDEDFKIIEKREGLTEEQKIEDAEQFDREIEEKMINNKIHKKNIINFLNEFSKVYNKTEGLEYEYKQELFEKGLEDANVKALLELYENNELKENNEFKEYANNPNSVLKRMIYNLGDKKDITFNELKKASELVDNTLIEYIGVQFLNSERSFDKKYLLDIKNYIQNYEGNDKIDYDETSLENIPEEVIKIINENKNIFIKHED